MRNLIKIFLFSLAITSLALAYREPEKDLDANFLSNINSLPTVVELTDTDLFVVDGRASITGDNLKDYIAGTASPVTDTDSVLKADFSTGFGAYVTALQLKNYVQSNAPPITNSNLVAVVRNGVAYKTTALYLKTYLTGGAIDWLPVVVMAGQSNMEGDNSETTALTAPYTGVLSNAKIYFKTTSSGTTNGVIQSFQNGVNNQWRTSQLPDNGPEVGVAYHTPLLISHQIGIVKYSLGGSRLVDDGVTNSASGLWDVNGDAGRAGVWGLHYYILVNNFVKPAIQKFIDAGFTPRIYAFSWCQGEADATIQYCALNYETKLTQLLNQFKTDLASIEPNVANMNIIITRIHNNFNPGTRPYLTEVRTAQANVAANYLNAHMINSDGYAVKSDNIHWTRQAQAASHGQDVANVIASIYN